MDEKVQQKTTAGWPQGKSVRVKTCGKSARMMPVTVLWCKPRSEQDQTLEESRPGSLQFQGRSLEADPQGPVQINDRPRQNSAYRSACFFPWFEPPTDTD